jgi:UDPglucose--hexose-1-phosphate uridylyltransferase
MAELRLDPATRRWVVTGKRPVMPDVQDSSAPCAFCPGNEHMTPKPICVRLNSSGAWEVRAFHDRAPVFRVEGQLDARGEGLFDRMNTLGAHEIVVETPEHGKTLAQLSPEHIEKVLEVCRDRIQDLKRDRRFRYVSLYKDQGPAGPTDQGHSHCQILATPVLAYLAETELRVCREHFRRRERCLYCDIIRQELQHEKRVVDENGDFIALCPFASRTPYGLWLLPLSHASSFEKDLAEPVRVRSLAAFLKSALQRVEAISRVLHLEVHTEPNLNAQHLPTKDWWAGIPDDFHWHIEITPEIEGELRYLGREGFYFNPIPAEEAALILRALDPRAEARPGEKG